MPSYKLYYFPGRGRAEITRFVLAAGNIEYEDIRIGGDKWGELKPKTPAGHMPVFEADGVMISESQAIAGFAAEIAGMRGETPVERAQAHMVAEMANDMFETIVKNHFEKDEAKKAEKSKEVTEKLMPALLGNLEKILVSNGGEFFVGSKLSYADIALFNLNDLLSFGKVDPMNSGNTPKLAALVKKVAELPGVKAWLAKRPESHF